MNGLCFQKSKLYIIYFLIIYRKDSFLDYNTFSDYLFNLVHTWCVHVHKDEYLEFLDLIFLRITKKVKIIINNEKYNFNNNTKASEIIYVPTIKVVFFSVKNELSYEKETWEPCVDGEQENPAYDHIEINDNKEFNEVDAEAHEEQLNGSNKFKRPFLERGYDIDNCLIYTYEEKMYYEEEIKKENPLELIKIKLCEDDEIVPYGFVAQYILSYFRNNAATFINLTESPIENFKFKIANFKFCEKYK